MGIFLGGQVISLHFLCLRVLVCTYIHRLQLPIADLLQVLEVAPTEKPISICACRRERGLSAKEAV